PSSSPPQCRGECSSAERRLQVLAPVAGLSGPRIRKHGHSTGRPFLPRNNSSGSNLQTFHTYVCPDPSLFRTSGRGNTVAECRIAELCRGMRSRAGFCCSFRQAPDPEHCATLLSPCLSLLFRLPSRRCHPPFA